MCTFKSNRYYLSLLGKIIHSHFTYQFKDDLLRLSMTLPRRPVLIMSLLLAMFLTRSLSWHLLPSRLASSWQEGWLALPGTNTRIWESAFFSMASKPIYIRYNWTCFDPYKKIVYYKKKIHGENYKIISSLVAINT